MRSLLTLSALIVLAASASAYGTVLTSGHTDVAPIYDNPDVYNPNGLGLNIHQDPRFDGDSDHDYDPTDTLLLAGANSIEARPSGSAFDFIGVAPGASYWHLPDTFQADKLYLGIGMDELDDELSDGAKPFAKYTSSDPRYPGTASWVDVSLVSYSGPGQASAWAFGDFGQVVELFSTTDGVGAEDHIMTPEGGDNHFNWAFTQAGAYDLTFVTSAYYDINGDGTYDSGDQLLQSDPTTIHFQMTTQAVPEPTTLAALGLSAVALLRRRRKA